jgi:DNA-binding beta-propeller fold protein YncE
MDKIRRFSFLTVPLCFLLLASVDVARGADEGYHVLKKIEVGGEGGWDYLTMDSAARRLYISRGTRVMVLDVDEGKIVGEIANTPGVHGIALVPELDKGFTSNGREGTVTVFSLKTLAEMARVKVGKNPDAIFYDPASRRVFTFNGASRDATAIDAESGKVVGTVKLEGRPESAASDERGQIYVNIEDKHEVVAFDAQKLSVIHRWSLAPDKEPAGLAMDRTNRRLFSTCHSEKMVILDADSGKIVATPAIGKRTDACVFDPETGLAFSSNGDGTLTVVHEESPSEFRVVANVPTQLGARTMALDTKTHNILLATARVKPAPAGAKGRQRPSFEPGSFVILVVGK